MLKKLAVQALKPGMVIVKVTQQNGPIKIKKSGLVTSVAMVQGLIEMGIQQVQVDLDQSVELEQATTNKSPTQKMLENNHVKQSALVDGHTEHTHRSLFLPSVQDIPSPWQFYSKRYLLAAFLILGGLGLGWSLAYLQANLSLANLVQSQPVAPAQPKVLTQAADLVANQHSQANSLIGQSVIDTNQSDTTKLNNEQVNNTQLESPPNAASTNDTVEEGELLNASQTASETQPANISAQLLQRFEKAMSEVEEVDVDSAVTQTVSDQDVPRIDQLPTWVMTRLPSMAFSAHMYASDVSERWVRVNGTRMVEGDKIDGQVEILRIEPQHVILNYSGQSFSMAALTDW